MRVTAPWSTVFLEMLRLGLSPSGGPNSRFYHLKAWTEPAPETSWLHFNTLNDGFSIKKKILKAEYLLSYSRNFLPL
jgi:hypothetical protein